MCFVSGKSNNLYCVGLIVALQLAISMYNVLLQADQWQITLIFAVCRLAVPLVLTTCAEVIEQHGIVDGIYRLSGVASNIQKLRSVLS